MEVVDRPRWQRVDDDVEVRDRQRHRNLLLISPVSHFVFLLVLFVRLKRHVFSRLTVAVAPSEAKRLTAALHERAELVLQAEHGVLEHVLGPYEARGDGLVGGEVVPLGNDSDELVHGVKEGSGVSSVGPDWTIGGDVVRDPVV
ncbi:hypothetical protein V8G54_036746 [Vigna mungo]|uniref:Uncharacterized protein n=1 Tax=Vigna mungo TaxID=3915 RepID=A0AAQ3MHM7_VIGMU